MHKVHVQFLSTFSTMRSDFLEMGYFLACELGISARLASGQISCVFSLSPIFFLHKSNHLVEVESKWFSISLCMCSLLLCPFNVWCIIGHWINKCKYNFWSVMLLYKVYLNNKHFVLLKSCWFIVGNWESHMHAQAGHILRKCLRRS